MSIRSKIGGFRLSIAFFAITAVMMLAGVAGATKIQEGNMMFILDASGSMWGQVEGKAKIAIAKEVLAELIEELPDGLNVGLVAYGHRRKGDCNDVEELVPLGALDKQNLIKKIKALSPRGKTPITLSVKITAEKLKTLEDETTIILVSDGKETCEGDPCALVKELRESGVRFVMHVIGFDVTAEERNQLECIAGAGGGMYYAAKNAGEFQMAAKKVIKQPEFKGGILEVKATKNGKPFTAWVYLHRSGERKHMTYKHSTEKRPASFKLLPGVYDIKLRDDTVPEKPEVNVKGLEVKAGETLERTVEFTEEGFLEVSPMKAGKLFTAWVYIHRSGEKKHLTYKHSTEKRPASFKLLPGVYDIKLRDDTVPEKPVVNVKGVEVKAGETVERIVEFAGEGVLEVSPVKAGKPFGAWVYIHRSGEKKHLTYKHSTEKRPASFKLLPGVYDIKVRDDSVPEKPVVNVKGAEIKAGETVERIVEFAGEGFLEVSPVKAGELFGAWVYIHRSDEKKHLTYKRSSGKKPASFKLLPGIYDIKVRDDTVPEKPVVSVKGLEVKSGETLERTVAFTEEGFLDVSPVKEGKQFAAWVYIHRSGEKKHLTYKHATERRPASFKLLPGVYDIKVKDKPTKSVKEIRDITIESGETQTVEAAF